jgi:hypothetical protein
MVVLAVSLATFLFFYGGRDSNSGTDSQAYAFAYVSGDFSRWEWGYALWLKFLRTISYDYRFYFFFETFIKLAVLSLAAFNVSRIVGYSMALVWLSLILYSFALFDLYTNGLRQGFAMTISVLALSLYFRGLNRSGLFIAVIAPFFHYVYLIFTIIYIIFSFELIQSRFSLLVSTIITSIILFFVIIGIDIYYLIYELVQFISINLGIDEKILIYSTFSAGNFLELNAFGRFSVIFPIVLALTASFFGLRLHGHKMFRFFVILALSFSSIYMLMAYQAYSYRYLYIVIPILPFIFISGFVEMKNRGVSRSLLVRASVGVLILTCMNFFYLTLRHGDALKFRHFL